MNEITFVKYFPYDTTRMYASDCCLKLHTSLVMGLREELHRQRKVVEKLDYSIHDNKEAFLFMDSRGQEVGVIFADSSARFGKLTERLPS